MEDTAVFVLNVDEDTSVGTTGSAATGNLVVEVVWIDDVATEPTDQQRSQ